MTFVPIDPVLPFGLRAVPVLRTVLGAVIVWTRLMLHVPRHDVIHAFTAAYWGFLLWTTPAVLVARLCGKPVVVNYRDGRCDDHLRHWPGAVGTLRMATRIVTPSGYLATVMAPFGLVATVIPNMIDASRYRFREREPLRPIFLSNRALEPLYHVDCILRAFAIIQRRLPEARLLIAHDGPCRTALEALAAELGLKQVEWRGKIAPDAIADLYNEADVYLNAPTIDNMPGSLLECFASGLAIVSTDAGGIPLVVQHNHTALLVPSNDAPALAAAALRLWDEPGLARRITESGLAECASYQPGSVLSAWSELYQQVAKE
jgi:glycosyltransferase involved in cell wall biosynthesis